MDEGLRVHKAGLRKIRHMMIGFNTVMITFVALTIWELVTREYTDISRLSDRTP